jgi:hypothetical protein
MTRVAIAVVVAACGGLGCSAGVSERIETDGEPVIWDNGLLEYSSLDTSQKFLANSTGILVESADVTNCTSASCLLRTSGASMCPGQRFANQSPVLSACTAFIVGPRQMATASHCFSSEGFGACAGTSVVFHWRKDSSSAANKNILLEHIYTCESVLFDGGPEGQDWAVFEVDRDITSSSVTPRGPLALARSRPAVGTQFDFPQHFAGLPIKYELGALSDAAGHALNIQAKVDLTGGSSGSPWIETSSNRVLGVASRGPTEVQEIGGSVSCIIEKDCQPHIQQCLNPTDKPSAAPAWHMPKGPRSFVAGSSFMRPTNTVIIGDFDGDTRSDIFWYEAGSTPEAMWFGNADRTFVNVDPGATNGTYQTFTGDFDGDKRSDILWYRAGTGSDVVDYGNADRSLTGISVTMNATAVPVIGDFDRDGRSDILWYVGGAAQVVWYGNANRTLTSKTLGTLAGSLTPIVGDFDGDRRSDIFWYGPGSIVDIVWYGASGRTFTAVDPGATNGTYVTRSGDFNGDGRSDILWYRPGSGSEIVDYGQADRTFSGVTANPVNGTYTPTIGDFDGNAKSDIFWHASAKTSVGLWWGLSDSSVSRVNVSVPTSDIPLGVADFDGDGLADLALKVGSQMTSVWGRPWTD